MTVMDNTDKKILNMIQEEFPLTERPFEEIGKRAGLTEKETLDRIMVLRKSGYIRRIGPVLEPKRMGYKSLLCAAAVPPDSLEEVAGTVSTESGVTHNYERDDELNLWFTVTMKQYEDIDLFLNDLENKFSITIYRFPEKRTFKIKTRFMLK